MADLVRVLIVDDSAYVRKVMRQMLSRSPFIEVVGAARDGEEALELVEQLNPDVVTLDLNMPNSDGLDFLNRQMARRPISVIVVSIASSSGELVIKALDAGAIDVVRKPTALATDRVLEIADDLIAKVKAAGLAKVSLPAAIPPVAPAGPWVPSRKGKIDVVVIGVSTGGPQALKQVIPRFPANLPIPIAMVLHMPIGYTEPYARNLNELSAMSVSEARDGEPLKPGCAVLAAAGYHLSLVRSPEGRVVTRLSLRPFDLPHRPAVDVLFRSASDMFGERVLGVVLTGMGTDGTEGAAWIKSQGGSVFTEADESCVVYGMPRSVVEAGLSDRAILLPRMAEAILEAL